MEKKKKRKIKKEVIWIGGVGIAIIILAIVLWLFFHFKTSKEKNPNVDKTYLYLGETIDLGEYQVTYYMNNMYVVNQDNKSALMDENGNLKTQFIYDYIENLGNLMILMKDDKYSVVNQDLETLFDDAYVNDATFCDENHFILRRDSGYTLIDKDGKILLEGYDEIFCQNGYVIAQKDGKDEVYDSSLHLLLEDVHVAMIPFYDFYLSAINSNFILLKEDTHYQIYYVSSKELSSSYDYATITNDYVAYTEDNHIIVKDKEGTVVNTFEESYTDYTLITPDIISIADNRCKDEEWYQDYRRLYNSKGEEISDGQCNTVNQYTHSTIVQDKKNHFTVYNDKEQLFEYQGEENSTLVENEYSKYQYYKESGRNIYLDSEGKQKFSNCAYGVEQLDEDIYLCNPAENISYIYVGEKQLFPNAYRVVSYQGDYFFIVQGKTSKYGLLDREGNQILEEKYDDINIYNDVVIISYQGKTYAKKIQKGNYEDYKQYLASPRDIEEIKKEEEKIPSDFTVDINSLVKKYHLENQKKILEENSELLREIVYHAQNNKQISEEDRGYLYSLFGVIVDYQQYMDISKLLESLDTLKIFVYDEKPENMRDFSAGEYHSDDNSIHILKWEYDYAIRHELMHFISFANQKDGKLYSCPSGLKEQIEVLDLPFEEQAKCDSQYFNTYNTFFEEAGAEYFTRVVDLGEYYRSYPQTNIAYNLLQYILEDDFKEVQYSLSKEIAVSKLLNEKLGYSLEEVDALLNALHNLNQLEQEYITDISEQAYVRYKVADELVKLYETKKIGDWKDNPYVAYSLYTILNAVTNTKDVDIYLSKNQEAKLDHYEELKQLDYDNYSNSLLKTENIVLSYSADPYFMREGNQFKIEYSVYNKGKLCEVDIYYDGVGKMLDHKLACE